MRRWLELLLKVLVLAAALDFVLARLFSRVGIFIPKGPVMQRVYTVLADIGVMAFHAGLLLAGALLIWLLVIAWRGVVFGGGWGGAQAAAVLAALTAVLLASLLGPASPVALAGAVVLGCVVIILGAGTLRAPAPLLWKCGFVLLLGALVATYGVTVVQALHNTLALPGAVPHVSAILTAGELAALLAPVCFVASCFGRGGPVPWRIGAVIGALGAVAFGAVYLANADMAAVLAIWSLGFTLSWPGLLYAAALAAGLCYLAMALAGRPEERLRAYGLALVFIAGYALQVNAQHLMVVLGLSLTSQALGLAPFLPRTSRAAVEAEPLLEGD